MAVDLGDSVASVSYTEVGDRVISSIGLESEGVYVGATFLAFWRPQLPGYKTSKYTYIIEFKDL